MKSIYLFPNKLKIPALVVFIISFILILLQATHTFDIEINTKVFAIANDYILEGENLDKYSVIITDNIYNEILDITFFLSGVILAFSKEKTEDEMIGLIRYKSLTYSTDFTFSMLILSEIFIYGASFIPVIMFFFYGFILFLNIFYYTKLFIYKKQFSYENED
ncbi:hypothetical protein [Paenimyroides baculatum]|uniref:Uncharacterized protein n=1 Tax=Paenimyroides baculatum TaxID=2608000 RepID=A0A5M6CTB0_9FLAO|nr:hypothetical protein [Paenimyroides baculatum]KAA5538186.1 hypothetical protein F0460_00860 [Paenimyroides baculatum]